MKQRRRLNTASTSRKTPVIAAVAAAALVAAGTFGGNEILKTQEVGSDDVKVTSSTASFADGESVIVDDPAISTQGEGDVPRTVKEFTRDEEFSIFGLTWEGERDIAAFVRAERPDGSWSEWYQMDPEAGPEGTLNGTEPIYIEPTKKIQVSTANVELVDLDTPEQAEQPAEVAEQDALPELNDVPEVAEEAVEEAVQEAPSNLPDAAPVDLPALPPASSPAIMGDRALPTNYGDIAPVADVEELPAEGAAAPAPTTAADLEAVFIDGGEGTVDGEIAPAQYNTNGMPRVISRSSWGAGKSSTPVDKGFIKAITVHHTAGSNNYTEAQSAGIVRGIWKYHAVTKGWGDIGYHALVDKYGNIYEGHAGGMDKAPMGTHVGGFNSHVWGVSMMGDYTKTEPSQAALNSMADIIGWKTAVSNIDPMGKTQLTGGSFSRSKYPAGQTNTFPVIHEHRDLNQTTCPGDRLSNKMGYIRTMAQAKKATISSGVSQVIPAPAPNQPSQPSKPSQPSTGTVPNNDGTTTTINNLTNTSSKLSFEDILSGDPVAIAAAVGTVGGAVLLFAASNDLLPKQVTNVGNTEILPGLTLSSLRPHVGKIINLVGSPETKKAWSELEPMLGKLDGVIQGVGGDEYGIFEKGIALISADGNQVIMPEKIADAWLKQGLDLGPLGKPVKSEGAANNGDVRVDFARGSITYSATTGNLDVSIN